jgi:hypothetical protein
MSGLTGLVDYGEIDEQEPSPSITTPEQEQEREVKVDPLDEVKRLREEVQKSFQKREITSCHIRIDNFQRPLTLRTLILWLEEKLNLKISETNVWVNNIKTHCYVTFESTEEAKYCKETIEGLKYPPTNVLSLVVNYTKLPASEASGSSEAILKYQDWLITQQGPAATGGQGLKQGQGSILKKRLGSKKEKILIETEGGEGTGEGAAGSSLGKRKSLGTSGSVGLGGAMFGVLRNTLHAAANAQEQQQVKSPRIDRHTTPRGVSHEQSITTTSSGVVIGSVDHLPSPPLPSPSNAETLPISQSLDSRHQKSGRTITNTNKKSTRGDGRAKASSSDTSPRQIAAEKKELGLDDFFKKTTSVPRLYWLPISAEEVEKRRNQKKDILTK